MARAKKTAKTAPTTPDADIARRIWLAGVGAYGRAFTNAQGEAVKLAAKADDAFDQLVLGGEIVEDQVRAMIAQNPQTTKLMGVVAQAAEKAKAFRAAQTEALEARFGKVKKQVGEVLETAGVFNPMALMARIDALEAEVAALKSAKTTTRRPAARAAAATISRKAAKPAAKKTASARKAKA
jgi:polyhydroxyalkanoate synthesis regulator phasin